MADVKTELEDALQHARPLEPTGKPLKHYTGTRPADLQLDVPGELIELAIVEVREKRKREAAPRINIANPNYFDRSLANVPTVPSAGHQVPIPGPSKEEQLNRVVRLPARDLVDFVCNNPMQMLELTTQPAKVPTGPPILYDIRDGNKIVATLHRDDYRVVLATVQAAMADVTNCKGHDQERCSCWRGLRDQLT